MFPLSKGRLLFAAAAVSLILSGFIGYGLRTEIASLFGWKAKAGKSVVGRVTYVDQDKGLIFLQEGPQQSNQGIRVETSQIPSDLIPGQKVEVLGSEDIEATTQVVRFATMRFLDRRVALPEPASLGDALHYKPLVSRWVEVTGIVRSAGFGQDGLLDIVLAARSRLIALEIPKASAIKAQSLVDSVVRVRGVLEVHLDADERPDRVALNVNGIRDVSIVEPAKQPDAIPIDPVDTLLSHWKGRAAGLDLLAHRVHLRGAVTRTSAGGLTLQDKTGTVPVIAPAEQVVDQKDYDLFGFVSPIHGTITLQDVSLATRDKAFHKAQSVTTSNARSLPDLTTIVQIHRLSMAEAQESRPLRLHAFVTYFLAPTHTMFIADKTGGIFVATHTLQQTFEPGQEIDISGISNSGDYSPIVDAPEIKVTGRRPLPDPAVKDMNAILSGWQDGNWVEMNGVVRAIGIVNDLNELQVSWGGRSFRVMVERSEDLPRSLIDAEIRVRGVCTTVFNSRRQMTGIALRISSTKEIVVTAKSTLFQKLPVKRIQDLGTYSMETNQDHRQRVTGVVTFARKDGLLYLQDGSGALRVEDTEFTGAQPGDLADVAGFTRYSSSGLYMTDAEVQVKRRGVPVKPVRVSAEEALEKGDEAKLLQIDATLMDRVSGPGYERLALRSGHTLFDARLEEEQAPLAATGSRLRLNGICQLPARNKREQGNATFTLLLRSPADVEVLRRAPWWTSRAFYLGMLAIGSLSGLACIWAILLRRQVNQQTRVIRGQLEEACILRQEAEAAARTKGEFLANMSHEIRTPLNGVLGMTELVLAEPLSVSARENLQLAHMSGLGLLQVINDVLDVSKMEAGRMTIESVPFNLNKVLSQALGLFKLSADQKKISISFDYAPGAPHCFHGDSVRIRQIVLNLVGNAIKFTEKGGVRVKVLCQVPAGAGSAQDAQPALVSIAVSDSGIGITDEQRKRLFQSFSQADASTTRRYGGTGLGLAISKQLVELMGGSIDCASKSGEGSTFTFCLPLRIHEEIPGEPAEVPRVAAPETMAPVPAQPDRMRRVLLAEDNAVNQIVAQKLLQKLNCQVDVAPDGKEAVRLFKEGEYDLVFMDCQMPELDGYEASKAIREWELSGNKVRTPIVALTASALTGDRERCLRDGMDDHLTKPLRTTDLTTAIARWTSQPMGPSRDELTRSVDNQPAAKLV